MTSDGQQVACSLPTDGRSLKRKDEVMIVSGHGLDLRMIGNLVRLMVWDEQGGVAEHGMELLALTAMAVILAAGLFQVMTRNAAMRTTIANGATYLAGNFGRDVGRTGSYQYGDIRANAVRTGPLQWRNVQFGHAAVGVPSLVHRAVTWQSRYKIPWGRVVASVPRLFKQKE
jgi:hypothetical protein